MAHLSLRAKSLVALAFACLIVLVPALVLGMKGVEQVRLYFGQAYAENLTQLNRQRMLAPIALDLALSRRLAGSQVTRAWLRDESDVAARDLFFAEADGYRRDLHDKAYFAISARSGNYYFNDAAQPMSSAPRYQLSPTDPGDAWFYDTLRTAGEYNINVNPDLKLKITRVWINVLVRDGDEVLGVAGASIDLNRFLDRLREDVQPGVTPLLFDASGAIQAHPDSARIAYNSGTRSGAGTQTIFDLTGSAADAEALKAAVAQARATPAATQVVQLDLDGARQVLALAYIPELDWYAATGVDTRASHVVDSRWLIPAAGLLVAVLAALMLCAALGVERLVLRPIRRLQQSARAIANGNYDAPLPVGGDDEIGDLSRAFGEMTAQVRSHTQELEQRVQARTIELQAANEAMAAAQKRLGDSIDYASLIQRAILPDRQLTQTLGEQHFVIWRPRDVVGGDFYVYRAEGENCLLGLMDCAGHGVPGALMTMLVRAAMDVAINDIGLADPAALLTRCDTAIRAMLSDAQLPPALATNADAGLVYIDRLTGQLRYAGARIDLYASNGSEVELYRSDKRALADKRKGAYANQEIAMRPGWTYYLVTDGFLDQAGGEKGFGFGDARFEAMLREHAARPLHEQADAFSQALASYQGDRPQRDDITLLSFRFESRS